MALNKYNYPNRSAGAFQSFFNIAASDFGVLAPGTTGTAFSAGANLAASASGGSLATTTGAFKISWVTAYGESLPSVEATVAVTGATGSVTVSLASVGSTNTGTQLNAAPIIGWNVYSGSGAGNEQKNTGTNADLSVATLTSEVLPDGSTLTFIPIATTSVVVKVYGNGAVPPVVNNSGLQLAMPAVGAATTADLDIKVPFGFKPQMYTAMKRPAVTSDTAGETPDAIDCLAPSWAASAAFAAGAFIVVGSKIFQCTVAGTTGTAPNVPNFAGVAKYGTITDNTATWKSYGSGRIVRLRFGNNTAAAVQPTANEYDLFQI